MSASKSLLLDFFVNLLCCLLKFIVHASEGTADGEGLVSRHHAARNGVNIAEVNLDLRFVLGTDKSVGGRALAGNVQINNLTFVVLHFSRPFLLDNRNRTQKWDESPC